MAGTWPPALRPVNTQTGLGQDGGHISAAGTFACFANISRCVAGGACVVLRGDVPPAPAVVVTCNSTVTAGMCHYPAARGPFHRLSAANRAEIWALKCPVMLKFSVQLRLKVLQWQERWEWPCCLSVCVCLQCFVPALTHTSLQTHARTLPCSLDLCTWARVLWPQKLYWPGFKVSVS